jgi:hypothetical protein
MKHGLRAPADTREEGIPYPILALGLMRKAGWFSWSHIVVYDRRIAGLVPHKKLNLVLGEYNLIIR